MNKTKNTQTKQTTESEIKLLRFNKDRFLTTEETAEVLGLKAGTLQNMRIEGKGISYYRFGRHIKYRKSDVINYIQQQKVKVAQENNLTEMDKARNKFYDKNKELNRDEFGDEPIYNEQKKSLEGKYFLTFPDKQNPTCLKNQGRILTRIENGYYLVQMNDFVTGDESNQQIFHIEDMDNWRLYEDAEYWRQDGQQFVNRNASRIK